MEPSVLIENLLLEQLHYELCLRGLDKENMTKREMTKALRQALKEETEEDTAALPYVGDFAAELAMIETYLTGIKSTLSLPPEKMSLTSLSAHMWHLTGRLNRVQGEDKGVDKEALTRVGEILRQVEARVEVMKSTTLGIKPRQGKETGTHRAKQVEGHAIKPSRDLRPTFSSTVKSFASRLLTKEATRRSLGRTRTIPVPEEADSDDEAGEEGNAQGENAQEEPFEYEDEIVDLFRRLVSHVEEPRGRSRNRRQRDSSDESGERRRHPTPVRSWQIKWSGDEKKDDMTLRQFLRLVERQAMARGFDANDLFNNALYLLGGKARTYFLNHYQNWNSWTDLKRAFRLKFLSERPDFTMLDKIIERKQGEEELTLDYVEAMQSLFNGMESVADDEMQIHYIIRNMRDGIRAQVKPFVRTLRTVNDLVQHCKNIEEESGKKKKKPDGHRGLDEMALDGQAGEIFESFMLRYFDQGKRNAAPIPFQKARPMTNQTGNAVHVQQQNAYGFEPRAGALNRSLNTGTQQTQQQPGFHGLIGSGDSRPQQAPGRAAGSGPQCWNCGSPEHGYRLCPNPIQTPFCFRCGRRDTVTPRCPNCTTQRSWDFPDRGSGSREQ